MNFRTIFKFILILSLGISLFWVTPTPVQAATTCLWDGPTGNWSTIANWSCGFAPAAGDTAVIKSGTVTVDSPVTVGSVSFQGGTVTGGMLTATALFDWVGGTLSHGTLNIPGGAVLNLVGSGSRLMLTETINNMGSAYYLGGTLTLQNSGIFNNNADGVFDVQGNYHLYAAGDTSTFNNAGTLRKSGGTGGSDINVVFNNTSQVDTQIGQLRFNGGGASTGEFKTASGAENQFPYGTYTFNAGTTVTGTGLLRLNGGTLQLNGAVGVPNLTVESGTLNGGTLTLGSTFDWLGGTLVNGTLTIPGTGVLNLSGTGSRLLNHHTVNNSGTTHYNAGSFTFQSGTAFNNELGGFFDVESNVTLYSAGDPSTFNNAGTLRKLGGTGAADVNPIFNNTGQVDTQVGRLRFNGGGASTGEFKTATGAENQFPYGTYTFNAGTTVTGTGTLRLNGGTLQLNGTVGVPNLTVEGGTLNGGTLTLGSTFNWLGGTLSNGTLTIPAAGVLNLSGTGSRLLNHHTVNNSGTTHYNAGSLTFQSGTAFNNELGGFFDVESNVTIYSAGDPSTFNNAGTLRKSGGTGAADINPVFNNTGQVDTQIGQLRFNGGGSSTGEFNADTGAENQFPYGTYTFDAGTTATGDGSMRVNGGTILIISGMAGSNLVLDGGIVTGGTFTLEKTMYWNGGTLGNGVLDIPETGVLNLNGTGSRLLNHHTVNNAGTTNYNAGSLTFQNGAAFNNQTGGVFDFKGNNTLYSAGDPSTFNNAGTLRKSGGTGSSDINVVLNNTSQVDTQVGRLRFNGGGASTGEFKTASGAENQFPYGTYTFNTGTTVTGTGRLRLNGGTLQLNGTVAVPWLAVESGTLNGGTLTLGNSFEWYGGTLANGTLTIPGAGVLNLIETSSRLLNHYTINNSGTTNYNAGSLTFQNGAAFNNQTGGVFDFKGNNTLYSAGDPSTFRNAGTLRKSGGTGNSDINPVFYNSGRVETQAGQFSFGGGGIVMGEFNAASGTENRFSGGTFILNGTTQFSGDGIWRISGGTVAIDGNATATHFSQSGGALNFTSLSSSLVVSRNFNREGGTFNPGTGIVLFNGGTSQLLSLGVPTTFNNLGVGMGTDLYEANPNQATVTGTLTNYGTLHAQQMITGTGEKKFGLTGVGISVTSQGTLTQIQVQRKDVNHPNATPGINTGRYWTLTATGSGFLANLSLPHYGYNSYARACQYSAMVWKCGGTPNSTHVVQSGVTGFSDWAVYNPPAKKYYMAVLRK